MKVILATIHLASSPVWNQIVISTFLFSSQCELSGCDHVDVVLHNRKFPKNPKIHPRSRGPIKIGSLLCGRGIYDWHVFPDRARAVRTVALKSGLYIED